MKRNFILYVAAALLFQSLAACSPGTDSAPAQSEAQQTAGATTAAATPAVDEKLVLAFGDSLYAGYQLGPKEGLAPQLEQALDASGTPAQVVNAGVSGDTSAAARQRLAFTLDGLPRKPDLVLVGLGGNDMLRGVDPVQTRANLTAILDELQRREIPAMLTGMLAAPNLGPDYRAAFESIYPDLARRYDVPLYPFILEGVLGQNALMLPDRIHPNPQGVQVMVEGLTPAVKAALAA